MNDGIERSEGLVSTENEPKDLNGKEKESQAVAGRTFWDLFHLVLFNRILWVSIAFIVCAFAALSAFNLAGLSWDNEGLNFRIGKSEAQIAEEIRKAKQNEQEQAENEKSALKKERLIAAFEKYNGVWNGVRLKHKELGDYCSLDTTTKYLLEFKAFSVAEGTGSGELKLDVQRTLSMSDTYRNDTKRKNQCIEEAGVSKLGDSFWDVYYEFAATFEDDGEYAALHLVRIDGCGESCFQFKINLHPRPNGDLLYRLPDENYNEGGMRLRRNKDKVAVPE